MLKPQSQSNTSSGSTKTKKRKSKEEKSTEGTKHKCKHCNKFVLHDPSGCWEKPGNESKKPSWMKRKKFKSDNNKKESPSFSGEQLNFLIQNAHIAANTGKKKSKVVKKRHVTYKEQSESESDNHEEGHIIEKLSEEVDSENLTDDNETVEDYFLSDIFNNRNHKKKKTEHSTSEVVSEIINYEQKVQPIRVLFDTGTTSSIILKPFVNKISKFKNAKTKW